MLIRKMHLQSELSLRESILTTGKEKIRTELKLLMLLKELSERMDHSLRELKITLGGKLPM